MNENQNVNLNPNPDSTQNQGMLSMQAMVNQNNQSANPKPNDDVETLCAFKCPKCGFGVSSEATICLHCGFNVQEQTGAVAKDNIIYERVKEKKFKGIIITNILITAVLIAVFFFKEEIPYLNTLDSEILQVISLVIYIPSLLITMFYNVCYEMLLHKAGLPWWGVFIPIYNIFEFYELCTTVQGFVLWNLVPVAIGYVGYRLDIPYYYLGIIISILIIYISMMSQLASRFDANKLLMILFPGIYMPIVAINKNYQIS